MQLFIYIVSEEKQYRLLPLSNGWLSWENWPIEMYSLIVDIMIAVWKWFVPQTCSCISGSCAKKAPGGNNKWSMPGRAGYIKCRVYCEKWKHGGVVRQAGKKKLSSKVLQEITLPLFPQSLFFTFFSVFYLLFNVLSFCTGYPPGECRSSYMSLNSDSRPHIGMFMQQGNWFLFSMAGHPSPQRLGNPGGIATQNTLVPGLEMGKSHLPNMPWFR